MTLCVPRCTYFPLLPLFIEPIRQIVMNEKNLNNISRTNWQALDSMSDENIDYSDIPPLTDEFFEKATLQIPAAQAK